MSCSSCYPYSCCCGSSPVRFRSTTAVEWVRTNPILKVGEPGYESDEAGWKIGDGVTTWVDLPYQDSSGPIGATGPVGPQGPMPPPYNLQIGTVTVGPVASATITGTSPNQVLHLVLPTSGESPTTGVVWTLQPASKSAPAGSPVTFNAIAQSDQTPVSYQWQTSKDGTSWESVGIDSQQYTFTVAESQDGLQVRCVATSPSGTATSLIALLSVTQAVDPLLAPPTLNKLRYPSSPTEVGPAYLPYSGGWTNHACIAFASPAPPTGTTLTGQFAAEAMSATGDISTVRAYPAYLTYASADTSASAGEVNGAVLDGYAVGQPQKFRVAVIGSKGRGNWSPWSNEITPLS